MAFTAKISDPAVGGTYMTLLNTITNLGMIYGLTCICCVALYMSYGCLMYNISSPIIDQYIGFFLFFPNTKRGQCIGLALLQWFLRRRNNRDFYPLCIWNACLYYLMVPSHFYPLMQFYGVLLIRNRHDSELIVTFLPWLHSRVIGFSWHDVDDCVAHRREFKTNSRLLFF